MLRDKAKWVRPVNFLKTQYNHMVHRYHIPPESTQNVFLSLDDDFNMTCDELQAGFDVYRENMLTETGIGPWVAYHARGLSTKEQKMAYAWNINPFYNVGLTGTAFVSRHFLDLFYFDDPKFNQIRREVE